MKRYAILSLLFFTLLTAAVAQPLQSRLQALLANPLLSSSEVGIAVYDLTAEQEVFAHQSNQLYRPASVMKLLTAITALTELGANHRFSTSVYYQGTVQDSLLLGDLYIVGGFDPMFNEASMQQVVSHIRALGIKEVRGRWVGDVSMTDSLYYGNGWMWNDVEFTFQPCLSPLLYNKGVVTVTVDPLTIDSIATVTVSPSSSYYTLVNNTRVHQPKAGELRIGRNWLEQGNVITVQGNVTKRVAKKLSLHTAQGAFFMQTLTDRLTAQGILLPPYEIGEWVPSVSQVKVCELSLTLDEVLTHCLKKSDNLEAEAVLRHLPLARGVEKHIAAADGIAVIEELVVKLGFNPQHFSLVDGSGVSVYNYISPKLLVAFLRYAHSRPACYAQLRGMLPIAGVDGSLAGRMHGKRVRAKTGTLAGVSSLAGYAEGANGHLYAFAIINQNCLKPRQARSFQDAVCNELCK